MLGAMHTDATRAIIEITGDDRVHFLQGLTTQDITHLRPERGLFAALLTPQGKIQHDFFLLQHGDAILLDCDATQKDALLKRLSMYKLRAKVALRDATAEWQVAHRTRASHAAIGHVTDKKEYFILTDPRAAELGDRLYCRPGTTEVKNTVSADEYHRHRLRLGVPDGAHDIADDVALDAGYDALGAVSFTKGCFVGQEVTARMHYKNIARRGFYIVEAEGAAALPASGTPVKAGGIALGTLRGSHGTLGLAMLKFEETEAALEAGSTILVDNIGLQVHAPAWLQPKLAQFRAARENQ